MKKTRLSSKGQVVLPKTIRDAHNWQPGQEFNVFDTGDGVLLREDRTFESTQLEEVAGCLRYQGKPKSLEDMEKAIELGVKKMEDA